MEKFPMLQNEEVVIVRCESNTGHILDENFKLVLSENQKVYTIFSSLSNAVSYIESNKNITRGIDFAIYDKNNNLLKYFSFFQK